jgi:hypothetical protein
MSIIKNVTSGFDDAESDRGLKTACGRSRHRIDAAERPRAPDLDLLKEVLWLQHAWGRGAILAEAEPLRKRRQATPAARRIL